jgi:hypothetical protein
MTLEEQIVALQQAVGPQRVKTPDVEVEQFSLKDLATVAQKNVTPNPTFGTLSWTKVVPKDGCSCERD